MDSGQRTIVAVKSEDGTVVHVEAVISSDELETTSTDGLDLKELADVIRVMAQNIRAGLQNVKPTKTTAELGLKLAAESGGALKWVVDVSGEASITIGLEWSEPGAATA